MTMDSNGIMKLASTSTNRAFRPGKRNTAKANPAIEFTTSAAATVASETSIELPSARGKSPRASSA